MAHQSVCRHWTRKRKAKGSTANHAAPVGLRSWAGTLSYENLPLAAFHDASSGGAPSGSLVKRSRLRPLTPATRVRFPHESPFQRHTLYGGCIYMLDGVYDVEVPPVPIPNTVVKLNSAYNTWLDTAREDWSMPSQAYWLAILYRVANQF